MANFAAADARHPAYGLLASQDAGWSGTRGRPRRQRCDKVR